MNLVRATSSRLSIELTRSIRVSHTTSMRTGPHENGAIVTQPQRYARQLLLWTDRRSWRSLAPRRPRHARLKASHNRLLGLRSLPSRRYGPTPARRRTRFLHRICHWTQTNSLLGHRATYLSLST